jgi:hypothetical protein
MLVGRCATICAGIFSPLVALVKGGSSSQQAAAIGCMWALAHASPNNKVQRQASSDMIAAAANINVSKRG